LKSEVRGQIEEVKALTAHAGGTNHGLKPDFVELLTRPEGPLFHDGQKLRTKN
jgi:hypothetical protein